MVHYFLEFLAFGGDGVSRGGFDFVARGTVFGEAAFDFDDVAVELWFVGLIAGVEKFDDDGGGTGLAQILEMRYFSPSLMRFFKLEPRFVAVALPPRQIVRAVRIADFPEPLCPMMKLILSPRGT